MTFDDSRCFRECMDDESGCETDGHLGMVSSLRWAEMKAVT